MGLLRPESEKLWLDEEAGPVVRPYAMTQGRTRPNGGDLDLITLVMATRPASSLAALSGPSPGLSSGVSAGSSAGPSFGPESIAIMRLCERPHSVAEVSAHLDLPIGTVRVLLGDLLDRGLIVVSGPHLNGQQPSQRVLNAVINGLRSL